jgi:uncharacterized protein (DUF4415 family)
MKASASSRHEKPLNGNENCSSEVSETDLDRLDSLKDEDIDLSDIPEVSPEEFARGIVREGLKPVPKKKQVTLRLDEDVLDWFKRQGSGYQTRINALLRAYMQAHEGKM